MELTTRLLFPYCETFSFTASHCFLECPISIIAPLPLSVHLPNCKLERWKTAAAPVQLVEGEVNATDWRWLPPNHIARIQIPSHTLFITRTVKRSFNHVRACSAQKMLRPPKSGLVEKEQRMSMGSCPLSTTVATKDGKDKRGTDEIQQRNLLAQSVCCCSILSFPLQSPCFRHKENEYLLIEMIIFLIKMFA